MLRTRSTSRRASVALLAAVVLLFTQFAMASQGCMLATPGLAVENAKAMEGCGGMAMQNAVCQTHCATVDQVGLSLDKHFPFVFSPAAMAAAVLPRYELQTAVRQTRPFPAVGPPLRVRYCSYLI